MAINYNKYIMSTSPHYISNSGKDENNAYHGGKAGDQSGHEWELKPWYSRPWSVVLRYPDPAVGLKIAQLGIAAALNNKIGYDQYQRASYWAQLRAANYDPAAITVACEEDCTAGVTANVKAAGFIMGIKPLQELPTSVYSGNMRALFVKAGFRALTASKYTEGTGYLLPGDVLLYEGHHAATNVSYGKYVRDEGEVRREQGEGNREQGTGETAAVVVITGGTVNVRAGAGTEYPVVCVARLGERLPWLGQKRLAGPREWYRVRRGSAEGWVSGRYSRLTE